MPDCVREALAPKYQPYLDIAEREAKLSSKKESLNVYYKSYEKAPF